MRSRLAVSVVLVSVVAACGAPENPVGERFEICSNKKDDNGDGKTDCSDPDCFDSPVCAFDPGTGGGGGTLGAGGGSAGGSGGSGGGGGSGSGGGGGSGGGSGGSGGGSGGNGGGSGGSGGGSGGGSAGGSGGGSAGGSGGGSAGGSGGGSAGGSGGSGGGAPSACATAFSSPGAATNQTLWNCGVGTTAGGLGACSINSYPAGTYACESYVKSTRLCTATGCAAPITGSGCSDKSYYTAAPLSCSGDKVTQSACLLRYLILHGHCAP